MSCIQGKTSFRHGFFVFILTVVLISSVYSSAATVQFEEAYRKVVEEPDTEKEEMTMLMCHMDGMSNTSVVVNFTANPDKASTTAVEGSDNDFILMNKTLTFPANMANKSLPIYVAILNDDKTETTEVLAIEISNVDGNNVAIGKNSISYIKINDQHDIDRETAEENKNAKEDEEREKLVILLGVGLALLILVFIMLIVLCICCAKKKV